MSNKKSKTTEVSLSAVPPQEAKPERTMAQIQAEYQQLCFKAGQLQYQVKTGKDDLELVNKELRSLNLEAAAMKADEAKKAADKAKAEAAAASEGEKSNA